MENVKITKEYLTDDQRTVLAWISEFIRQHDYAPAVREIGKGLHMTRSNVQYFLTILESKKYIKTPGRKYRNLRLI